MKRLLTIAAVSGLLFAAGPALADETTGQIEEMTHENITVGGTQYKTATFAHMPEGLKVGDTVKIEYENRGGAERELISVEKVN